jgi:hypothetical protein
VERVDLLANEAERGCEEETMMVCERCARRGTARGPPGTVGAVGMSIGRGAGGAGGTGGFLVRTLAGPGVAELVFPRLILVFRPRVAKKPPLDLPEDPGDALSRAWRPGVDVERGDVCTACAKDGYGREGIPIGEMSSLCRGARSVAVDASGRMGKVASEKMEDGDARRA